MAYRAVQEQLNIEELRDEISRQLRSNAAFSQTVYQEQPIIMTGRQLRSYVPDAIQEARQIAKRPEMRFGKREELFYAQARHLAGYTDDYEFTRKLLSYYPSYETMSNEELRWYFTWRTKVRQGQIECAPYAFVYLYLCELINLIGASSAREGYELMYDFASTYTRLDPANAFQINTWLDDFVVYYQLDPSLLKTMGFLEEDAAYETLLKREEHSDAELFNAICRLSAYPIADSPFFLEHEAELQALVAHAYRTAAKHHDTKLKTTLVDRLFGRMQLESYTPFENALFADPLKVVNLDYTLSPHDTIYCRDGLWWRARFPNLELPCPWLTKLLESTESILRDAYEFPNTLNQPFTTKYIVKAITVKAEELMAERRAAEARAVHIDMSKLDGIRSASEITCEKLIVEEEELEILRHPATQNEIKTPARRNPEPKAQAPAQAPAELSGNCPLEPVERKLVCAIMAGTSVHDFERENSCIASVLIDSINEKLYNEFADICIETNGDEPEIIEDYIGEIKELLAA